MTEKRDDADRDPTEPLGPGADRTDPLGLGGTPDPDAPSREPRPKPLALLGEFLRMSRTSAILLIVFVLVSALYLLVKDDPVVNINPTRPATTEPAEPTGPADPTDSVTPTETGTEEADTSAPTTTTGQDSTRTTEPGVGTTDDARTTTPGGETPRPQDGRNPGSPPEPTSVDPTGSQEAVPPGGGAAGSPSGGDAAAGDAG